MNLWYLMRMHMINFGIFSGNFNSDGDEWNSTVVPLPARCTPLPKVVSLRTQEDLLLKYSPSCTRVNRCGGCCIAEELMSCQPTEIRILNMRVRIHKYIGRNNEMVKTEIVKVEEHLKCKCDCIVKAKDCNRFQTYIKEQCGCVCSNNDEKKKCLHPDEKLKFWDSTSCSCQCLEVKDCTTGYVFNQHTCSCESEHRQIAGQHWSGR